MFPGLIYRVESPRVVVLVFVSGKICVTGAKSRSQLLDAVQKLYPLLYKFKKAQQYSSTTLSSSISTGIPALPADDEDEEEKE